MASSVLLPLLVLSFLCVIECKTTPYPDVVLGPKYRNMDPESEAMCEELLSSSDNVDLTHVPRSCLCYSCKGSQGQRGLKGAKGEAGRPGVQVSQGTRGLKGDRGEQGIQGAPGTAGRKGSIGDKGEKGDFGAKGAQGTQGPPGSEGVCPPCKGERGDQGASGLQGLRGDKGDLGLPGKNGLNGTKGDKGEMGFQGLQGSKGNQGDQGLCNCKDGEKGAQGIIGPQGSQGSKGDVGQKGAQGEKGSQGTQGEKGVQGEQGFQGIPGPCTSHIQSSFTALLTVSYPKSTLPVPFGKVLHNPQNHFNTTSSIYTAPVNGTYLFSYQLSVYGRILTIGLFRNSKLILKSTDDANRDQASQLVILHLDAGDAIWLQVKNDQSNGIYFDSTTDSTFSGYLMQPDLCEEPLGRSFGPSTQHSAPTHSFSPVWPADNDVPLQ